MVDGKPVARVGDQLAMHSKPSHPPHPRAIAEGSSTVMINGVPAAITGGTISCGGVTVGSGSVVIGDSPAAVPFSGSTPLPKRPEAAPMDGEKASIQAPPVQTESAFPGMPSQPGASNASGGDAPATKAASAGAAVVDEKMPDSDSPEHQEKAPKTLRLGVFFDGTGNHMENDRRLTDRDMTNVARLFGLYFKAGLGELQTRVYIEGPGTIDGKTTRNGFEAQEDILGLALGVGTEGGHSRIEKALQDVRTAIEDSAADEIVFDIFGFSRGAALARHFVNLVNSWPEAVTLPRINSPTLSEAVPEFKEVPAFPPGVKVRVGFVGLFDTVGSFYFPGSDWDLDFNLHLGAHSANKVVHLTAFHEIRANFPLTKIRNASGLPANFVEKALPGVHSDVGGGYENPEVDFQNYERFEVRRYQGHGLNYKTIQSAQEKIAELNDSDPRNIQPLVDGSDMVAEERRPTRKELSYYALREMHRHAVNAGVPLSKPDDYPMPAKLEGALNRWLAAGGQLSDARDYLYDYIHTSHRVDSIPHRPEPDRVRRHFLSRPHNAAMPRSLASDAR
jgi:hypothetical protein